MSDCLGRAPLRLLLMITASLCVRPVNRADAMASCDKVCHGPLVPCEEGVTKSGSSLDPSRRPTPADRGACDLVRGLTPRQRKFCRRHPDLVAPLAEGVRLGTADCRSRFRHRRWNCHALGQHLDFGHVQVKGTPEAAVMYALQSAAVTYTVYAACRRGQVSGCSCLSGGPDTRAAHYWKWTGCRRGLTASGRLARRFLNARELEMDARSLMNRHNNRAGIKAVTRSRRRRCVCHEHPGSCSVPTCWLEPPRSFAAVGDRLQRQLASSQLVQLAPGERVLRLVAGGGAPARSRLVHLQPSPSYCEPDPESGFNGTVGRPCRKERDQPGSCEYLCCGRGYNTKIVQRRYCCNYHISAARPTVCMQRTRVRTCQ